MWVRFARSKDTELGRRYASAENSTGNSRAKENTFEANFPTHLISPSTLALYLDVKKKKGRGNFLKQEKSNEYEKCTKFSYENISRRQRHIWKARNEQSIGGSILFIASSDFRYFIRSKAAFC